MKIDIHDTDTEKGMNITLDRVSNLILDDKPFLLVSAEYEGPTGPQIIGTCTVKSEKEELDLINAIVIVMESPGPFNRILSAAVQKCALRIATGKIGKYNKK